VPKWKLVYQASGSQKQTRVAILLLNKVDLKLKLVREDIKDHYILIKEAIQ
jgi:hypothetical protein